MKGELFMSKKKYTEADLKEAFKAGGDAALNEVYTSKSKDKGKSKKSKGKKKKKNLSPKEKFEKRKEEVRFELAKIMLRANGISPDSFFVKTKNGIKGKPVSRKSCELETDDFINRSKLNWNKNHLTYSINSNIFCRRFLTAYIEELSNKIYTIGKKRSNSNDTNFGKYESIYFNIQTILEDCLKLETVLCNTNNNQYKNFSNILLIGIFNSNYSIKKTDVKKLNALILSAMKDLKNGLNPVSLLTDKLMDDDVAMRDVMSLAWYLSTGSEKMFNIFSDLEGKDRKDDITIALKVLGRNIRIYHAEHDIPIAYTAFKDARPFIHSKNNKYLSDVNIRTAYEAILFVDFITAGDKSIHKLITKMLDINESTSFSFFNFK